MKTIKNISMQGFSIPFGTRKGVRTIFLTPKQQIEVPDNWKSKIAENLVHRRMVKIVHVPDPAPVTAVKASSKKTRTTNPETSN